jgi:hypothetical protein
MVVSRMSDGAQGGAVNRMKRGQLMEFSVKGLPGALREAVTYFEEKKEAQHEGYLHKPDSPCVMVGIKQHAVRGINYRKIDET